MKKRVVVGLSGGVDSSVAAYLLQQQGYDVVGVFMKNWHDTEVTISDDCPWEEDSKDALLVAEKLNIPFHTIDLSEAYRLRIVDYMFDEYEKGRTPNPDVLCNREIKFDLFLSHALKLQADFVATGHYCYTERDEFGKVSLHAGKDNTKDQSYFLCQTTQHQLQKSLFPLGKLLKKEVREIALSQGLATAQKKDSQGLCFIGKVKLPDFLKQQLKEKIGEVILISKNWEGYSVSRDAGEKISYLATDGKNIGTHTGAHYYTIGQRKGLNIGGFEKPLFILQTNTKTNTIYVGEGEDHPGLYSNGLYIRDETTNWIDPDSSMKLSESKKYQMRIRYRQPLFTAILQKQKDRTLILFETPQKAVAAGQFAAWYEGDKLVGSGVIE